MQSNPDYLLKEAARWLREGRITEEFYASLVHEYRPKVGEQETGNLRTILFGVGGAILFLGIFFLFTIFWGDLVDAQKFGLLVLGAAAAAGVGIVLDRSHRFRILGALLIVVGLGLYFFSLVYVGQHNEGIDTFEFAVLLPAFAGGAAATLVGLRRIPVLAFFGPPAILGAILATGLFFEGNDADALISWLTLVDLGLLALFVSDLARPRPYFQRQGLHLGALVTALAFVPLQLLQMYLVLNVRDTWTGILVLALYGGLLLFGGVPLRFLELVLLGGLVLVGDAIWLGADKGGLIGTVIALLATAAALIALGQTGVLRKLRMLRKEEAEAPRGPDLPV